MVAGVEGMADQSVLDGRLELSWLQVLNAWRTKVLWTTDLSCLIWSQVLKARWTKVFWTTDLDCLGRRC